MGRDSGSVIGQGGRFAGLICCHQRCVSPRIRRHAPIPRQTAELAGAMPTRKSVAWPVP